MKIIYIILIITSLLISFSYASLIEDYNQGIVDIEYPPNLRKTIQETFPFLQILDDFIEWTAGIRFYTVKNKDTGEIFNLYFWLGEWSCRQRSDNGKYWFWNITNPIKWRWKNNDYIEKEYKND